MIVGADGVKRRWVYLHDFKEGQPSLSVPYVGLSASREVFHVSYSATLTRQGLRP